MIILGIVLFLVVVLPIAVFLIRTVTKSGELQRAVQRTTAAFQFKMPRRNGRSPLMIERRTARADESSRITSVTFPAFR